MRETARLRSQRGRRGFTLIELLVVIGIISVLAALTAAATLQVLESQRQSATETTLRQVTSTLQKQMQVEADRADKQPIPANVLAMAGGAGNERRARVIWRKLWLKREFPITFAEARAPHLSIAGGATALTAADLPPNPVYVRALQGVGAGGATESAACLLLALQQSRGGVSLVPDSLGNAALDTNRDGLKEIVDGWGQPVAFYRWPIAAKAKVTDYSPPLTAAQTASMDSLNPALEIDSSAPVAGAKNKDPLDPEGTLQATAWWGTANRRTFESLCHAVTTDATLAPAPQAYYVVPLIVSNGRNNLLGLVADPTGPTGRLAVAPGSAANSPSIPPTPVYPPLNVNDAADNIYNFRLRLGARGD